MPQTIFDWNEQRTKQFIAFFLGFTAIIYYLLHTRYILYDGDDVWFLTRIHHYFTTGLNEDTIFAAVEVTDRTQIFYVLYNSLHGYVLNFLGWTKSNVHLISTFFIAGSAILWYYIAKQLRFDYEVSLLFAMTMLLFPVFFGAANLCRPDPLAFFLASISFLLFLRQYYLLAGLMIMVAFESHLMSCMFGFYILVHVGCNWKDYAADTILLVKNVAKFTAGILLGCVYFYYLHMDVLTYERVSDILLSHRTMGKDSGFKHLFISYFLQPLWYLHVFELILIILTFYYYIKHKLYKKTPFLWATLLVLFALTLLLSRPNRNYMIYFFPILQLMSFYTFKSIGKQKQFVAVFLLACVLQYGYVYIQHRTYDFGEIATRLQKSLKDPSIPVVGMTDNWYAAKEHPYHLIYNSMHHLPDLGLKELYLIQTDYMHNETFSSRMEGKLIQSGYIKDTLLLKRRNHYFKQIKYFKSNYDCQELDRFPAFKDQDAVIYKCQ